MNRILELRQHKTDAYKAMEAARAQVAGAQTSADKAAARTAFNAARDTFDGVVKDLEIEEQAQERERLMPAIGDPDRQAANRATGGQLEVGRDRTLDDPKKGFHTHREFLDKVLIAGMTHGSNVDQRLRPLAVQDKETISKFYATAGSDEGSSQEGQYGAFLVPSGFSPTLLQLQPEDDPISPITTKIPMASPTVAIPARVDKDHRTSVSGGLTVTRRPQTADISSSRMKFGGVTLRANGLFGLSYATEELLSDSPISFTAILSQGFQQEFAAHAMFERLTGSGVGEPLGILNSPCLIKVAKKTGQTAATIVKENIDAMIAQCWKYQRSIWLANQDALPSLFSIVQVIGVAGNTVPYFQVDGAGNFTLKGRPLFVTEYCQTVGTPGDLVLGNWAEYLDGNYQPMESAESIHVRFVEHERTFKFWLRNDGQPWWQTDLTPKNSSNHLSPFLTTDTRA